MIGCHFRCYALLGNGLVGIGGHFSSDALLGKELVVSSDSYISSSAVATWRWRTVDQRGMGRGVVVRGRTSTR